MTDRLAKALSLLGLVVLFAACSPYASSVPAMLEQQFPLLDRLGVDLYWSRDDCHLFAYNRGVFSREQASETCWVVGLGSGGPMDGQAEVDFRSVADAFTAAGLSVQYIAVERDRFGKVGPGSFFVQDACRTFSLEGDLGFEQEEGALETVSPLGDGWYLVSSC